MRLRTRTRVQVTVEISDSQPWPPEATIGEIQNRAKEEALRLVRTKFNFPVIGDPLVLIVMAEEMEP